MNVMKTNFDNLIDRRGSGCFKYDALGLIYGRDDLISLWVADMDFAIAPAIREALQNKLDHGILGYNYNPPEFYEAVANWVSKHYGIKAEREWMLLTPGIVTAINLAVLQLTQPGDGVLIQTPVYRPFFSAVLNHGRKLLTNPLINTDGYYTIDFDDFERKIAQAKLLILCSPHNPVGRIWSEDELRKMGSLCRKYRVPIISDEIHADLVYEGNGAISIASLEDFADLTLCCCSPSKSFNIAGLSTAITIVKNPELREPLRKMIWDLHLYLGNTFGIEAVIAAYSNGEGWLRELLTYLRGNRDFMHDFIFTRLPMIRMAKPESTYLAWLDFRALGLPDEDISDLLVNKARLALDPGHKFGVEGTGFQRLNFGCPRSVLKEALQRLEQVLEEI